MINSPYWDNHSQTGFTPRRWMSARSVVRARQITLASSIAVAFAVSLLPTITVFGQEKKAKKAIAKQPEPKWVELINPKTFPKGWAHKSGKGGTTLKDTWTVDVPAKDDPVLICTGKPAGYLRTVTEYEDFELTIEWKYINPACNSGILLNIAGMDKVWPAAIQMQLHQPTAGSIIKTRDPKSKLPHDKVITNVKLETGKWHSCKIRSDRGTITVWINGTQVNEVKNFAPKKGFIGLQSEDSEIHFRRLRIRELKAKVAPVMVKSKKKPTESKKPEAKKKSKTPTT